VNEDNKVYHHFISFIWKEGYLVELDGRKKAPIAYLKCEQNQFMEKVFETCIGHYVSKDETSSFGLMALSIGG
jgi:ubiquitin carboxyl-terminal hydrolase L3